MNGTKMEVFQNKEFGSVRVVMLDGAPWFSAADVCKALDIANSRDAIAKLDADEKMTVGLTDGHSGTRGGAQKMGFVNEPGLYALMMRSRKPEAKAFQRWIIHEVIPCIRKHGGYLTESLLEQVLQEPQLIYQLAETMLRERQKNAALEAELQAARPKAEYFDAFVNPSDCTNIRATAKELQIPERAFCRFLQEGKFLYRCSAGNLMPYNKPGNEGLFIVRDYVKNGHKGAYTLITPKGKDLFRLLTSSGGAVSA